VAATGDGVLTGSRKIVDGGALVGKAALTAAHKARAHDVMTIDFSDIVGAQSPEAVSSTRAAADVTAQSAPTVNPWLDSTRASTTAAASRRQVATNRERKALDRGRVSDGASIREREARSARAAEEAGGGNELVIDLNNTLLTSSSAASSSATARKRESEADDVRDTARALPGFDLASASDAQQALINRAFATGPDDEEFHGAKKALVEANLPPMPDTVDSQAPGWGSWTGAGVVAKPMSSFKKRKLEMLRAQVEKERADALKKRRDAKLPDVVISEQRDKKVAPVQLSRLPYGYDTEAQLSALTAAPLGADWNSHRQHARLVHAPVTTRPGQLIEPMKPTPAMEKRASEILKKRSLGRSERKKQ
jgi:U3 small nucleolar RNA-associated protein 14